MCVCVLCVCVCVFSSSPPIQIPQNDILTPLDIQLHLHIHLFAPERQFRVRKVPAPIALFQERVDLVIGFLLGETVLAEDVDDVVIDAHGLLSVEGEDVVVTILFLVPFVR